MLKLTYGPEGFKALSLPEGFVLKNIAWGFQMSGDEKLDCPYEPFVGPRNHPTESSCFTVLVAPDTLTHHLSVSVTLTELFGDNKVIAKAMLRAGSEGGLWDYAPLLTWLEKIINKQLEDWDLAGQTQDNVLLMH